MVFSSAVFLFIFLPFVLLFYFLLAAQYRNIFLLIVSLLFYAWGEGVLVVIMIFSTCVNYVAGIGVYQYRGNKRLVNVILTIAIIVNLSFLVYYKYLNFIFQTFPYLNSFVTLNHSIILPIGISFYTFHGISYLVDTYRKGLPAQRSLVDLGLYIAFFPQLVAGPIVRYSDISDQLKERFVDHHLFFDGMIRFIRGLAKKIIIANTVGLIADKVFSMTPRDIPVSIAWFGIICYALQIYYDFSGYSDMAIGLAKMFGFRFKENFDHPYVATSVQDFWRRWHISLSSWFRDYVYISIGGNRKGVSRTYINLIIVFFITGLWHGASWNFIIWGLFHGVFLILERSGVIKPGRFPAFFKHVYLIVVILVGWVFFRADTLSHAVKYLEAMSGIRSGHNFVALISVNFYTVFVFLIGILFAAPLKPALARFAIETLRNDRVVLVGKCAFYFSMLLWSVMELAQASYNPFIYFRF